ARLDDPELEAFIRSVHEVVARDPVVLYLRVREGVARWRYIQLHAEEMRCVDVTVSEFLAVKERLVAGLPGDGAFTVEVDLEPFERTFPRLTQARSIGRGVEHLNRYLSGRLFQERRHPIGTAARGGPPWGTGGEGDRGGVARLLEFLRLHHLDGQPLMLTGTIESPEQLRAALRRAVDRLAAVEANGRAGGEAGADDPWLAELRNLGFEPVRGATPARARDTMELLLDILEALDPRHLADFLARVPMITRIAVLSPHGYFGQANVLGKPDTGGQVVYILDQVRALEH